MKAMIVTQNTAGSIYNIRNMVNDNIYIGSAINFKDRCREHKHELKNNKHHSQHLQNAWNKYGGENFEFKIMETVKPELKHLLVPIEQWYFDMFSPEYNICKTAGNTLGYKHPQELKRKMSIIRKGKKLSEAHKKNISIAHEGKCHSDETKIKMSIAKKGIKLSEEHKKNMSITRKGKKLSDETKKKLSIINKSSNNGFKIGHKVSEELKKKISIAHKGKKLSEETKNKIALKLKGNKYSLGHKHSDETRKKISIAQKQRKRKKHSNESKRKISITLKARKLSEEHKRNMSISKKGMKYNKDKS